jgi:Ca-activated chloride channel family protein
MILVCVAAAAQDRPHFTSQSDLVVLHVNVKDTKGAHVGGLTQRAFGVLEDGRLQTIEFFNVEDAPVTVGLLIDGSGSMQPSRERVIAAAAAFAEVSNPRDEMFALGFNEHVRPVFSPASPFTSDANVLRRALEPALNARGKTALFDAITAGLDYLGRGHSERKVLVVVSDGGDTASHTTANEALARIQASNAVIYTVALPDPVEREASPKLLERVARASGGEAFAPRDASKIGEALREIARDIRESYTLGYAPTNSARDRSFRRIRVVVEAPDRRRLIVRTRAGYLAAPPGYGHP